MAKIYFSPKNPSRFGIIPVYLVSEKIGALTSAATDTFRIPTPFRRGYVLSAGVQTQVVPVVTTGTATATLKKYRAVENSTVTLSAGLDLETLIVNEQRKLVINGSDTDRLIRNDGTNGDTLLVDSVNGTTIATAPTAMFFVVEIAILE